MEKLRFALFGAGFWSRYQLNGWIETGLVECVAVCDPILTKAEALADAFNIPAVYSEPEALLDAEQLDFVDICTSVETHYPLVKLAVEHHLPVVCQKPMGTTLEEAQAIVATCQRAGVQLLINENFRWQYPLRQLKRILDSGSIGQVFRARVNFANSFPVFENQPFLKTLKQFILTDMGSHTLDIARFLFGDALSLYCHIDRINPEIQGEDVATVMLRMKNGATVICELSYASRTEIERFPETYVYVEGQRGFLELGPDYWIRETTENGVHAQRFPPARYAWADPAYDLIHSSIVACQTNLAQALAGETNAETKGEDNLKTMELVFQSYRSAELDQVMSIDSANSN
jgi:D-apiose dehydrogenase